jgi:hypothetical protein
MKYKIFSIALIILLSAGITGAQTSTKKNSPEGSWKFEAPTAPEGYSSGKINISNSDKKYSVTIAFTEDYKISGEQVKFENNILSATVYVEGENVRISLKMDSEFKMTGTADYSQGQIPLTLTRTLPDKK